MQEIALSQLSKESKRKLFEGMQKSKEGRAQLAAYRELSSAAGKLMTGSSFMMKREDYDKYMKG